MTDALASAGRLPLCERPARAAGTWVLGEALTNAVSACPWLAVRSVQEDPKELRVVVQMLHESVEAQVCQCMCGGCTLRGPSGVSDAVTNA